MSRLQEIYENVIGGDREKTMELIGQALSEGLKPADIINKGLIAAMDVVGARFKKGEIFVPEVLMSARAMNGGLAMAKPLLTEGKVSAGRVVIGTIKDDLHDIGKNLVVMMIGSAGFEVIDIGINVPPERFVEAINEHNPDIVGISALLTTTMTKINDAMAAFNENNLRDKVKVIVGGAPVTQEFADKVGADGYAKDAASAVDLCRKLMG